MTFSNNGQRASFSRVFQNGLVMPELSRDWWLMLQDPARRGQQQHPILYWHTYYSQAHKFSKALLRLYCIIESHRCTLDVLQWTEICSKTTIFVRFGLSKENVVSNISKLKIQKILDLLFSKATQNLSLFRQLLFSLFHRRDQRKNFKKQTNNG